MCFNIEPVASHCGYRPTRGLAYLHVIIICTLKKKKRKITRIERCWKLKFRKCANTLKPHFLIASSQVPSSLLSWNSVESAFTDRKLNQARAGASKIHDAIASWLDLLNFVPLPQRRCQRGITDFNARYRIWAIFQDRNLNRSEPTPSNSTMFWRADASTSKRTFITLLFRLTKPLLTIRVTFFFFGIAGG